MLAVVALALAQSQPITTPGPPPFEQITAFECRLEEQERGSAGASATLELSLDAIDHPSRRAVIATGRHRTRARLTDASDALTFVRSSNHGVLVLRIFKAQPGPATPHGWQYQALATRHKTDRDDPPTAKLAGTCRATSG